MSGSAHSSFNIFLRPRSAVLGYSSSRVRAGFFFLFNFFLLIFGLFTLNSGLYTFRSWSTSRLYSGPVRGAGSSMRVRLVCQRRVKFFKTVQRGPMAHRQWSQEQYRFVFFRFVVSVAVPDLRPALLVSRGSEGLLTPQLLAPELLAYRSTLVSFYRLLYGRFFFFRVVL